MEATYLHSFSEIKAVETMCIFNSNLLFLYSSKPTTNCSWNTNWISNPLLLNIKMTWVNSCCLSSPVPSWDLQAQLRINPQQRDSEATTKAEGRKRPWSFFMFKVGGGIVAQLYVCYFKVLTVLGPMSISNYGGFCGGSTREPQISSVRAHRTYCPPGPTASLTLDLLAFTKSCPNCHRWCCKHFLSCQHLQVNC